MYFSLTATESRSADFFLFTYARVYHALFGNISCLTRDRRKRWRYAVMPDTNGTASFINGTFRLLFSRGHEKKKEKEKGTAMEKRRSVRCAERLQWNRAFRMLTPDGLRKARRG